MTVIESCLVLKSLVSASQLRLALRWRGYRHDERLPLFGATESRQFAWESYFRAEDARDSGQACGFGEVSTPPSGQDVTCGRSSGKLATSPGIVMYAHRTRVRIGDTRRVTVDLPSDFPEGDVEVIVLFVLRGKARSRVADGRS
jgi:hypothetical protein